MDQLIGFYEMGKMISDARSLSDSALQNHFCSSYLVVADHGIYWLAKPDFWKEKEKEKNGGLNLGPAGLNQTQNQVFCIFLSLCL